MLLGDGELGSTCKAELVQSLHAERAQSQHSEQCNADLRFFICNERHGVVQHGIIVGGAVRHDAS